MHGNQFLLVRLVSQFGADQGKAGREREPGLRLGGTELKCVRGIPFSEDVRRCRLKPAELATAEVANKDVLLICFSDGDETL